MPMFSRAAAKNPFTLALLRASLSSCVMARPWGGNAVNARYTKPALEMDAAVGKMWEPRLKSQRMDGRARDAGWDSMMGTANAESAAFPPVAISEIEMVAVWTTRWTRDMSIYVDVVDVVVNDYD